MPVLDWKNYGGIPSGGGFGYETEYEVGAQNMAEALHCILGSLGKVESHGDVDTESSHIREEMRIVEKIVDEYSKTLYITRVFPSDPPEVETAVDSIISAGSRLFGLAEFNMRQALSVVDPGLRVVAVTTYETLQLLAEKMIGSVESGYPDTNAFADSKLRRQVSLLRKVVDDYLEASLTRPRSDNSRRERMFYKTRLKLNEDAVDLWYDFMELHYKEITYKVKEEDHDYADSPYDPQEDGDSIGIYVYEYVVPFPVEIEDEVREIVSLANKEDKDAQEVLHSHLDSPIWDIFGGDKLNDLAGEYMITYWDRMKCRMGTDCVYVLLETIVHTDDSW